MRPDAWGFSDAERLKSPTGAELRAATLAAEQNCVLSTRQLHGLGLRDGAITTRVRRGTLHRVHRGVYSVVHPAALSIRGRLTAAVLACGDGAVLSHRSAAALWELLPYEDRAAEVIVPGDGGRKIDGIRAYRTAGLDRRDAWWRSGIRVTSPARTALDVAATMPQRALRRMLRQAQAEGRLAVGQLREAAARAGRHRVPERSSPSSPTGRRRPAASPRTSYSTSSSAPASRGPRSTRGCSWQTRRSCPTSSGGRLGSSSRWTACSFTAARRRGS